MEEAATVCAGNVSHKTIRRWATAGLRGIVLDSWFEGGRRYTSREAIQKFNAAITEARTGKRQPTVSYEVSRQILKATHGI
jgi:hypothetical protein